MLFETNQFCGPIGFRSKTRRGYGTSSCTGTRKKPENILQTLKKQETSSWWTYFFLLAVAWWCSLCFLPRRQHETSQVPEAASSVPTWPWELWVLSSPLPLVCSPLVTPAPASAYHHPLCQICNHTSYSSWNTFPRLEADDTEEGNDEFFMALGGRRDLTFTRQNLTSKKHHVLRWAPSLKQRITVAFCTQFYSSSNPRERNYPSIQQIFFHRSPQQIILGVFHDVQQHKHTIKAQSSSCTVIIKWSLNVCLWSICWSQS